MNINGIYSGLPIKSNSPIESRHCYHLLSQLLLTTMPKKKDKEQEHCAHCGGGGGNANLRTCSRCKTVRYCSRECQVNNWKEHKPHCTFLSDAAKSTSDKSILLKSVNETQIYMTHVGYVNPNLGMPIPAGVPLNINLMHNALIEYDKLILSCKPNQKIWKKEYEGEAFYKPYFDELVENEKEWMEFFGHDENGFLIMQTCLVLNTLATIHCKRGANEECGAMLEMYYKVFAIYKDLCKRRGDPDEWCDNMEIRAKLGEYQFNLNMERFDANVEVFRELAIFEAKYPEKESGHIMFFIREMKRKPTIAEIQTYPKKKILKFIRRKTQDPSYKKFIEKEEKRVKLLLCDNCGKEEDGMRQFSVCPRCKEVPYCGRTCQKEAWRNHKKVCGKSKTDG